ncbi:hypothetical protein V1508DRAFT_38163 [Lipomyces doorenjongii]|uniref:uncharacterized protein n=1 Tax=Lipomyces doorenjongii TaxID=383834 RepID=UPI0034CD83F7
MLEQCVTKSSKCPMFLLALHFFCRFHVDQEQFPVLRSNEHWFNTKLFIQYISRKRSTHRTTEIDYKTPSRNGQTECLGRRTFCRPRSRMQAARRVPQMAEIRGGRESQIRRAGRWNRR